MHQCSCKLAWGFRFFAKKQCTVYTKLPGTEWVWQVDTSRPWEALWSRNWGLHWGPREWVVRLRAQSVAKDVNVGWHSLAGWSMFRKHIGDTSVNNWCVYDEWCFIALGHVTRVAWVGPSDVSIRTPNCPPSVQLTDISKLDQFPSSRVCCQKHECCLLQGCQFLGLIFSFNITSSWHQQAC